MPDVVMPRLSDSMEEGTILRWLKADGDDVQRGDELAEIETDKATMTYEADTAGELRIVAAEGDTLPIGAVIATIGGSDGAAPAGEEPAADTAAAPAAGAPAGAAAAADAPTGGAPAGAETAGGADAPAPAAAAPAPAATAASGERVKASPVARRLARE
ncbi:MAG TPA: biotin/lipoyl-containing protein, partial [Solirubrobacteraceae bacterium]|nr:biotin/lipoyl-containing protein [Solirubrobacteraceae bacterium]